MPFWVVWIGLGLTKNFYRCLNFQTLLWFYGLVILFEVVELKTSENGNAVNIFSLALDKYKKSTIVQ